MAPPRKVERKKLAKVGKAQSRRSANAELGASGHGLINR
jgi:hypothetical protein